MHEAHGILHDDGVRLIEQLFAAREARARNRLVRADDEALKPGLGVEHLEHGHCGHRRAVGVGDDALDGVLDRVRVDLAHDERNLRVHAPARRVVDNRHARRRKPRSLRLAERRARAEDGDVEPARVGRLSIFNDDLAVAPRDDRSRAARTGKEAQLTHGVVALKQQLAHHRADLTRGADDADVDRRTHDYRPVPA